MIRLPSSRAWLAWLFCSLAGTVLIALPDPDRRLFSISEGHGPGVTDLVGALVVTTGWAVLDVQIWLHRRRLLVLPRRGLRLLVLAALVGAVVVAWSVERDAGMWWLLGVALLAGAQLVAAIVATADAGDRVLMESPVDDDAPSAHDVTAQGRCEGSTGGVASQRGALGRDAGRRGEGANQSAESGRWSPARSE